MEEKEIGEEASPHSHSTFRVKAGEGGVTGEHLRAAREQDLLQAVAQVTIDKGALRENSCYDAFK